MTGPLPIVLVFGDAALDWVVRIDRLPDSGGNAWAAPPFVAPGGTGANTAVALTRLDVTARFCGRLGEDDAGRLLRDDLRREGVAVAPDQPARGIATPLVIALVDADGERTLISCGRGSAQTALRPEDVPDAAWDGVGWVHATGILLAEEPSRSALPVLLVEARRRGLPVSFDLNLRIDRERPDAALGSALAAVLAASDVVFASAGEAMRATGTGSPEAACVALAAGRRAAVRIGADGVLIGQDGRVATVPAFPTDVVDLLGVGDAWDAGAIAALVGGSSLADAARSGNAAAALAARAAGARSSPTRDAHARLLRSGG